MSRISRLAWAGLLCALSWPDASAQPRNGRSRGGLFGSGSQDERWELEPKFKNDAFTFARVEYYAGGYGDGSNSYTDTPAADLNLTLRLHQMTSLRVSPGVSSGVTMIHFSEQDLAKYPFIYAVEVGSLGFRGEEAAALRKYLLNGGFFMADDFWGDRQWNSFAEQMKRVFPDRVIVELPVSHPIFHTVFDLKKKPQMPAIEIFMNQGVTWEPRWYYSHDHDSHFFGIFDDKGRMMVFISFNNDFGDGWEREGESIEYFKTFSEPQAYPMIINILFYAMTH